MKKTFFILMSLLAGSTVAFSADNTLRENNRHHRGRFMRHQHPHFKRDRHAEKPTVPLNLHKKETSPLRKPSQQRHQCQRVLQHRLHIRHHHGQGFHQQRIQQRLHGTRVRQDLRRAPQRIQQQLRKPTSVRQNPRRAPPRIQQQLRKPVHHARHLHHNKSSASNHPIKASTPESSSQTPSYGSSS